MFENFTLLSDEVDDSPAGDGIDKSPYRGVSPKIPFFELVNDIKHHFIDYIFPVRSAGPQGFFDLKSNDRTVFGNYFVQLILTYGF